MGIVNQSRDRGMAAVAVITLMLLLSLVVMGMVHGTARDQSLTVNRVETIQAFYAAEAGVNMATRELAQDTDEDGDGTVGSISDDSNDATDPVIGSAQVVVTATGGTGTKTLASQARAGGTRRYATSVVNVGSANRLMFVVTNSTSMSSQDQAKQTQFEAWGYTVTLIDDAEVQANYDAAVAVNDVAYISEEVSSGSVSTKMRDSAIGIVSEEGYLNDEIGFSSGRTEYTETQIDITDNSHYITSLFSTGLLTISSGSTALASATGTIAGGGQTLAERPSSSEVTMMVIETGGALDGGGTAPARRVLLAGGSDGFDFTLRNNDGLTITRRALKWAAVDEGGIEFLGHWKLDESSGSTALDSVGGNGGTYNNSPTLGETGFGDGGTSVNFNGTNTYIEVPHSAVYKMDDGAISFWFKSSDLSGHHAIISKDSSGFDTGGHFHIYTDGALLKVRFQSTTTTYTVQSGAITTGTWYHGVFTFGSNGMKLYLNDTEVDSDPYMGGTGTTSGGSGNSEPMVFGAGTWTSGDGVITPLTYYYAGHIDDVRIYNSAIDADDVTTLYGGGELTNSSMVISSWQEVEP